MTEVRVTEAQARKMGLLDEKKPPRPSKKKLAAEAVVTRASRSRGIFRFVPWCCGPEVRTATGRVLQEAGCGPLPAGLAWAKIDRHLAAHGGGVVQWRLEGENG